MDPSAKRYLTGGSQEACWASTAERLVGTRAEAERRVSSPGPWQRRLEGTPASCRRRRQQPLGGRAGAAVPGGPRLAFEPCRCPRGKD